MLIWGCTPDLIIVLQDGRVAEQGTHEELLKKGGLYYSMWVQQASDAIVEDAQLEENLGSWIFGTNGIISG